MKERSEFITNYNCIEIITTYCCNRKCYNCQAMIRQAPTNEFMTIEQIRKFIYETIEEKIEWNTIRIMGGEPALHPNIEEIVKILCEYKEKYSKETKIVFVTNGYGDVVNKVIKVVSDKYNIIVENSNKTSDYHEDFTEINNAPIDLGLYDENEYKKACWITSLCGIALDKHGYYMCSTAAAIDRIVGYDLGIKSLSQVKMRITEYRDTFCRLCGHFNSNINDIIEFNVTSESDIQVLNAIMRKELEQKVVDKIDENFVANMYKPVVSEFWNKVLLEYNMSKPLLSEY